MKTVHADWERKNLGVEAYEITLEPSDTPQALRQEEERIRALGARYVARKMPVNCPQLRFGMTELGYTFVETVFHVMVRRDNYHMPDIIARFDRGLSVVQRQERAECQAVYDHIRQGVFISDRVAVDPAFGVEKGGNRYANWLETMVRGGAFLYEVLAGQKPIGFFVIQRKDADTVDPVLMGMYHAENDRGLGTLLHKKTLDTCFTHPCKRLTSTVVSNNAKVLRVYVNAGAEITDMLYTYVKHM